MRRPSADEKRWVVSEKASGAVLKFPRRPRRFVAVQFVGPNHWRAAVFVGWHVDPKIPCDRIVSSFTEALRRAEKGAAKLAIPLVSDRCAIAGHGVWSGPA